MKRASIDGENLHIFWTNFNDDTFRKDVTYDNIKIEIKKKQKKNQGLILSLKNTFLEKPGGECQTEFPSLLRIKTLI